MVRAPRLHGASEFEHADALLQFAELGREARDVGRAEELGGQDFGGLKLVVDQFRPQPRLDLAGSDAGEADGHGLERNHRNLAWPMILRMTHHHHGDARPMGSLELAKLRVPGQPERVSLRE